ncbi:MAG: hypothetical protein NC483_06245 [Ruminococcus sp.]|nr:hypothetical protein [Ruminococcus sp.]
MQRTSINTKSYNYYTNSVSFKCQIKQVANKWLEKLSLFALDKKEVNFYIMSLLKPYILEYPLYWYTNPLVKIIKEHVGNELPTCFLFSVEQVENSLEFKVALKKEIARYQKIIINNEDITEEQAEELLTIIDIDKTINPSLILNFIIFKILTHKLTINSELYKKLFFKFIDNFKMKNNLDFYAFAKNIPDVIINGKTTVIDAEAKEKFGHIYIAFNNKTLNCNDLAKNLFVFFHEYWHTVQDKPQYTESCFIELFKMDEYLQNNLGGYEDLNYDCLSFESDANLNGLILLYNYLNSIGFTIYNDTLKAKIEEFRVLRNNTNRLNKYSITISLIDYFNQVARARNENPLELIRHK